MIRVKVGSGLTIALPVGPIQLHKIEKQQHRRWSVGEEKKKICLFGEFRAVADLATHRDVDAVLDNVEGVEEV